jgi:predicted transcriptional regulator
MNFRKEGYSVAEVSQVLHVTPATLRSWIDAGKMEANMSSDKIEKGHRRTIRITRSQLSRFIMQNQRKYPLDQYKAYVLASHAEEAESEPKTDDRDFDCGPAYKANSLSELTGAWAGFAEEAAKIPEKATERQDDATFTISINGRVALGNLGKETCGIIFSALANDSHFQFEELTIKRTKGGAK